MIPVVRSGPSSLTGRPAVVFVMAMKARSLSRNWEIVSGLCEATVSSAYRQTSGNFRILVVCHDVPVFRQDFDSRVEFLRVPFPPPDELAMGVGMSDKWRKIHLGFVRAREWMPRYIMIVDTDDLVSNRIVEFVERSPDGPGWIIRNGYDYRMGDRWILRDPRFNCGTNAILNAERIGLPEDGSEESRRGCIALRYGHTIIEQGMLEAGMPLAELPFHGAVYVTSHGENISHLGARLEYGWRHMARTMFRWRPVTRGLVREFAMDCLPSGGGGGG